MYHSDILDSIQDLKANWQALSGVEKIQRARDILSERELQPQEDVKQKAVSFLNGRFFISINDFNSFRDTFQLDNDDIYFGVSPNKRHILEIVADDNLRNADITQVQQKSEKLKKELSKLEEKRVNRSVAGRSIGGSAGALGRDMSRLNNDISSIKSDIERLDNEINQRIESQPQGAEHVVSGDKIGMVKLDDIRTKSLFNPAISNSAFKLDDPIWFTQDPQAIVFDAKITVMGKEPSENSKKIYSAFMAAKNDGWKVEHYKNSRFLYVYILVKGGNVLTESGFEHYANLDDEQLVENNDISAKENTITQQPINEQIENLYSFLYGSGGKGEYSKKLNEFLNSDAQKDYFNNKWSFRDISGQWMGSFDGRNGKKDAQAALEEHKKKTIDHLNSRSINDVIESVKYKIKSSIQGYFFSDNVDFDQFVNDMIQRLISGKDNNEDFIKKVVLPEYRKRSDKVIFDEEIARKKALDAEIAADNEDYSDLSVEPKFSDLGGYQAYKYNLKKVAKKVANWINTLNETTVYNAAAFTRAFNKSPLASWLKLERGKYSSSKDIYFETKSRGFKISKGTGNHLSLINEVMKLAGESMIFDSIYDTSNITGWFDNTDDDMILDEVSTQSLKTQFQTETNGMAKIALARQIIEARILSDKEIIDNNLDFENSTMFFSDEDKKLKDNYLKYLTKNKGTRNIPNKYFANDIALLMIKNIAKEIDESEKYKAVGGFSSGYFNGHALQIASKDKGYSYGFYIVLKRDSKSPSKFTIQLLLNDKNIFDSVRTLEDLKAIDYIMPVDLDIQFFVRNVLIPIFDKQAESIDAEFAIRSSEQVTEQKEKDVFIDYFISISALNNNIDRTENNFNFNPVFADKYPYYSVVFKIGNDNFAPATLYSKEIRHLQVHSIEQITESLAKIDKAKIIFNEIMTYLNSLENIKNQKKIKGLNFNGELSFNYKDIGFHLSMDEWSLETSIVISSLSNNNNKFFDLTSLKAFIEDQAKNDIPFSHNDSESSHKEAVKTVVYRKLVQTQEFKDLKQLIDTAALNKLGKKQGQEFIDNLSFEDYLNYLHTTRRIIESKAKQNAMIRLSWDMYKSANVEVDVGHNINWFVERVKDYIKNKNSLSPMSKELLSSD